MFGFIIQPFKFLQDTLEGMSLSQRPSTRTVGWEFVRPIIVKNQTPFNGVWEGIWGERARLAAATYLRGFFFVMTGGGGYLRPSFFSG